MSVERFFQQSFRKIEIIGPIKEKVYKMPTEVRFGRGALKEVCNFPQLKNGGKVVLLAGGHFKNSEDFRQLKSNLLKTGKEVIVYGENIRKSSIEAIDKLTEFCRDKNPDVLTAIGGGTVIDAGKSATVLSKNKGIVEDYIKRGEKLENKGIKFIAVPTTAGTGSEVTPWATVWDTRTKKKYSLDSLVMFPTLAIVDSQLTDSLPAKITAETGIDALAQAIEAYWSVKHNPVSDEFALEAIKLAIETLGKVVKNPTKELRDKMAKASLFTGLAFSNTQTTICHAVSYPITAHFNIPHGQAVAITLPPFIKYTLPSLKKERRFRLLHALRSTDEKKAREKIALLIKNIGLKTKLSQLGIKKKDIRLIVKEGFHPDRVGNAPKILTKEELYRILGKIL